MNEVERVEAFVKAEGLNARSRKHYATDRRTYLAVYLFEKRQSLTNIAKILGCVSSKTGVPDHATIKYYLEVRFPENYNQRGFINSVLDLMHEFPLVESDMKDGIRKKHFVMCELTQRQYEKLSIVRLTHRYKSNAEALISLL
jgi:hypothetical protein